MGKKIQPTMKIIIRNQSSNLSNRNIKWYLSDEKLWFTKFHKYADVEDSIQWSIGSFNWLYEVNDTLLFNKEDGRFETAIVDLSEKIVIADIDDLFLSVKKEQKGEIFLREKKNYDFEFSSMVIYQKKWDCLISFPTNFEKQNLEIIYIVSDFGFIIMNDQLEGWILRNASKHIYTSQTDKKVSDNNPELLEKYLKTLNLWEINEENIGELELLLDSIKSNNDEFSLMIKECIMNIFVAM